MTAASSQFIVLTSIFPPTAAVRQAASQAPGQVIVVGDRKTPGDWTFPGVDYISPDAQLSAGWRTAELLPWDHYARKVLGYLHAIAQGAQAIVDLDDDNVPHDGWGFPPFLGSFREVHSPPYYNVYQCFTNSFVWPRGFPLRHVTAADHATSATGERRIGVWQALADGDPDVDAIYRLTVADRVSFHSAAPVVLAAGTVCPFNSQNTVFHRDAFPLLYLPATVTFRSTDIVRAFVAQPVMWAAGLHLGFLGATVTQDRNEHDYLSDFESEVPLYLTAERVVEVARESVDASRSISENLRAVYAALAARQLVEAEELALLDAWLADLAAATRR